MTTDAPIVPAVVINAPLIFSRFLRWGRRPEVIVRFGSPVLLSGDPDNVNEARHNTEELMSAIAALLPVPMRGQYGEIDS